MAVTVRDTANLCRQFQNSLETQPFHYRERYKIQILRWPRPTRHKSNPYMLRDLFYRKFSCI